MLIDNYIDRKIGETLSKENEEERKNHVSSGKLTASMLGEPLQWQILKVIGVEPKPIDEYTLRKFKRGKDIETWLMTHIGAIETQKKVEYRDVVGIVDAVCDTKDWDFPKGIIPVEIKSVSNAKFKRIVKAVAPDRGHCLQACLYALAIGCPHFAVSYVATDDLRVHTFILETEDWREKVDTIINRFEEQHSKAEVPVFIPEEKWQADLKYNKYPEWSNLTEEEIAQKIK